MKLSDKLWERIIRLQKRAGYEQLEPMIEEMVSLAESVRSGKEDGYTSVILENPKMRNPNGTCRRRPITRNYFHG